MAASDTAEARRARAAWNERLITRAIREHLDVLYPPDNSQPLPLPENFPRDPPDGGAPQRPSMSENGNTNIAALQTKVAGLEHQFDGFRDSLDRQINGLSASIKDFADKVEVRFNDIARQSSERASAERSGTWTIVGIAVAASGVMLTFGATIGTLAKGPIDTELARHDLDLRALHETTENREELKADFKILEDGIRRNSEGLATKADRETQAEIVRRLELADRYAMRDRDSGEAQIADLRKDSATKAENAALNDRLTVLSTRLNDFMARFQAVPKYPVTPGAAAP